MTELEVGQWTLVQRGHDEPTSAFFETLFALSNGYQGIRLTVDAENEACLPGAFLSQVYEPALTVRTEIVNIPNWLPFTIEVAGAGKPSIVDFERVLDYRDATVRTRLRLDFGDGQVLAIAYAVSCHAVHLDLATLDGTVTAVERGVEFVVGTGLDARFGNSYGGGLNTGIQTYHCQLAGLQSDADGLRASVITEPRGQAISIATATAIDGANWLGTERGRRIALQRFGCRLGPSESVNLTKLVSLNAGDDLASATARVRDLDPVKAAAEHQRAWHSRWERADVTVGGDQQLDSAVRFGIFQLNQTMDPVAGATNLPARGLTSEYHSGHFFFNTEFFKLPYWILTDPDRARALMMFRIQTLDAARRHAAETGYRGARYPEEVDLEGELASPFELRDVTTGKTFYEWSGVETMFLSAAVGAGVSWYWTATGDDGFMMDGGLEVLLETARFGASLPKASQGGEDLEILSVMCPDEFHYHVDNSAFTNFAVRRNIEAALAAYEDLATRFPRQVVDLCAALKLDRVELYAWRSTAERIRGERYMPNGVIEQFDGYRDLPDEVFEEFSDNGLPVMPPSILQAAALLEPMPSNVVKEADVVLLHALFPEAFDDDQKRRDFDFYEPRTAFASSLAASPYGVVAGMLGIPEKAERYLGIAARYNLAFEPREHYHNGIHLAAGAGAWQVLVQGMLGLRITDHVLDLRPVALPASWSHLVVPIHWRGAQVTLHLDHHALRVSVADGGPRIELRIRGRADLIDVGPGTPVEIVLG